LHLRGKANAKVIYSESSKTVEIPLCGGSVTLVDAEDADASLNFPDQSLQEAIDQYRQYHPLCRGGVR
jgi:hypothetical protein